MQKYLNSHDTDSPKNNLYLIVLPKCAVTTWCTKDDQQRNTILFEVMIVVT